MCAQTEVENWLATAAVSPPDSIQAVTGLTVGTVSDGVAHAVVKALHGQGYYWSEADHVLCAFLAAAAQAMQQFQDQLERAVSRMVLAILGSNEQRPPIAEALARIAAQAAVDELAKLTAVQHYDDVLRAIRVLAVIRCPDPPHHRAVVQYCLSPLGEEILSNATRQELLDSLPRRWTNL
jgi:hypothetical protein